MKRRAEAAERRAKETADELLFEQINAAAKRSPNQSSSQLDLKCDDSLNIGRLNKSPSPQF